MWQHESRKISRFLRMQTNLGLAENAPHACDRAFNLCLSIAGDKLEKRQVFTAVAALSLNLWFLASVALVQVFIVSVMKHSSDAGYLARSLLEALAFCVIAILCWRRAQLYFHLYRCST